MRIFIPHDYPRIMRHPVYKTRESWPKDAKFGEITTRVCIIQASRVAIALGHVCHVMCGPACVCSRPTRTPSLLHLHAHVIFFMNQEIDGVSITLGAYRIHHSHCARLIWLERVLFIIWVALDFVANDTICWCWRACCCCIQCREYVQARSGWLG